MGTGHPQTPNFGAQSRLASHGHWMHTAGVARPAHARRAANRWPRTEKTVQSGRDGCGASYRSPVELSRGRQEENASAFQRLSSQLHHRGPGQVCWEGGREEGRRPSGLHVFLPLSHKRSSVYGQAAPSQPRKDPRPLSDKCESSAACRNASVAAATAAAGSESVVSPLLLQHTSCPPSRRS